MKPKTKKSRLAVHFSSKRSDWETPSEIFEPLRKEFNIVFDLCAHSRNTKCSAHYNKRDNSLRMSWATNDDDANWLNPPYGREIGLWVERAASWASGGRGTTVSLLPARTDTKWFHDHIYNKPNVEVRFLKGRVKFVGAKHAAPFPSMIVIFKAVE